MECEIMNDRDVKEQWDCGVAIKRFYGIDEYGEQIYREGGREYIHRKCGFRSAVGFNHCPRCGQKMIKVNE